MSVDALSDVLRAVRLTGAVYFDFDLTSPWVAEAPPAREVASTVMPGAQHVIEYHVIAAGQCWGGVLGEPPVLLPAGSIIVFPHGDPHLLSSEKDVRSVSSARDLYVAPSEQLPFMHRWKGTGTDTARVICGFLGCDVRPFNPLIAALPRAIHLQSRDASGRGWLDPFIDVALAESASKRPGGENVLARLSELMFVEVVRRYLDGLSQDQSGWLAGLRDRHVGRALAALHDKPAHPWTIDELGREAGLSRSALAERFNALVGQPPMQYLASWRMQLASSLLRDGRGSVAQVAADVGYESEAAFSRAFKRLVGVPPAHWRRTRADA